MLPISVEKGEKFTNGDFETGDTTGWTFTELFLFTPDFIIRTHGFCLCLQYCDQRQRPRSGYLYQCRIKKLATWFKFHRDDIASLQHALCHFSL